MHSRDEYFKSPQANITPFEFNSAVAACFDDMVNRSVPFYQEVHKILLDLISQIYQRPFPIYDLGCSTASTLILISKLLNDSKIPLIGVDLSLPMLNVAREKVAQEKVSNISLIQDDLANFKLSECGAVIMNYTLQFISEDLRLEILKKIYSALIPGGFFFYAEKLKSESSYFEDVQTHLYYDFKRRNGYSELEIAQKREALERRLFPLTMSEQLTLLKNAGFQHIEMPFRWYNFACFVGVKG